MVVTFLGLSLTYICLQIPHLITAVNDSGSDNAVFTVGDCFTMGTLLHHGHRHCGSVVIGHDTPTRPLKRHYAHKSYGEWLVGHMTDADAA